MVYANIHNMQVDMQVDQHLVEGEDDISINAHMLAMQQEMLKSTVDYHLIDDRMQRTLYSRRTMISQGAAIDTILESYPALFSPYQVLLTSIWAHVSLLLMLFHVNLHHLVLPWFFLLHLFKKVLLELVDHFLMGWISFLPSNCHCRITKH